MKILDQYIPIVGIEKIHEIFKKAQKLRGKRIMNVNSTKNGGGVAEILHSLIPMFNELGIKADWRLISGQDSFYDTTKMFHNGLQGENNDAMSGLDIYYQTNREFAKYANFDTYDAIVIHDPQPLALVEYIDQKCPWIFRLHIDVSNSNQKLWDQLSPHLAKYDTIIISSDEYKKDDLNYKVIQPAIDALSVKNKKLNKNTIKNKLKKYNIPQDKPIITQISRFDKWKDPIGVIETFKKIKEEIDCTLVLCGNMASDDPEGYDIYQNILNNYKTDDIILITENDPTLVNVLQTKSDVIFQKSTREGFGLCVLPDTRICTEYGHKQMCDIKIGDKVLTESGKFENVLDKTERVVDSYYNIICHKGSKIGVTKEHPFFVYKRKKMKKPINVNESDLKWMNVSDLKVGDYISVPIPKPKGKKYIFDLLNFSKDIKNIDYDKVNIWCKTGYSHKNKEFIKLKRFHDFLDPELQWLFGLYIGDGSKNGNFIEFNLNRLKEYSLAHRAKEIIERHFGCNVSIYERKNVIRVICSSTILSKVFEMFGKNAITKNIPEYFIENADKCIHLISGLFDSDGSYFKSCARYYSINENLVRNMWYILTTNRIPCTIKKHKNDRGYKTKNMIYSASIGGREYHKFINNIVRKYRYVDIKEPKRWSCHCIVTNNYILFPIKKIERVEDNVVVQDICVENTHSFVGNGYLLHNTLTESMFKQTSSLASNVGGLKLQIKSGYNGILCEPDDYEGFSRSAIRLLNDDEYSAVMGYNAKKTVVKKFLMTRLLEDYIDLFLEYI